MLNPKLNPRSFSEILESVQLKDPVLCMDFSAGWESHQEPFGLSHIMQLMSKAHVPVNYKLGIQKAYPAQAKPKKSVPRPKHQFNEAQSGALNVLKSYCPQISDDFNLHELKSAYRLSVLKTHPDQGGNSESFQLVKKSYHILSVFVKN